MFELPLMRSTPTGSVSTKLKALIVSCQHQLESGRKPCKAARNQRL